MIEVWQKVESIRMQKGLSVKEVAYRAGMTRQNYHALKYHGSPGVKTLQKIAVALGVHVSTFFLP